MNQNQSQNPQITNDDQAFCPSFSCYTSDTTSSSSAAAAIRISNSLPNQGDLYHEDNEFNFVIEENNNSSSSTTVYPLFNQKENSSDTLRKLFITEREDDQEPDTSSSDEEDEENEPVFCVWKGTKSDTSSSVALTKCKKSSSTGSGSKRWRIRDLLRRSNSEGKNQQPITNMLLAQHSNNKKVVEAVTKQKRNSVEGGVNIGRSKQPSSPSVHEIFYVQNRAKTQDGKRKSYLPYRQGLVGFFTNVNGKGKSFPF